MSDGYNESYVDAALNPKTAPKLQRALIHYIRNSGIRFDSIVCRGTSGLLVAPIVAQKMKKELIVSRKSDGNHSGKALEGYTQAKRFIIIDDFICTGNTIRAMLTAMASKRPSAQCVGIFGYRASGGGVFKWTAEGGTEQSIPKFGMWPADGCESFTYEPELRVRKPRAKKTVAPVTMTPATEAEKFFHKAATQAIPGYSQTMMAGVL